MQGYPGFVRAVYDGFLSLDAVGQVATFATVAAPLAPLVIAATRWATRKLKQKTMLIAEELERVKLVNQTREQRIEQLEKELSKRDESIRDLQKMLPSTCLALAEQERKDGNEERAIRALGQGVEGLCADLYDCCLDLAGYHISLLPDHGLEALSQAERLARIANLLQPQEDAARKLLAEILAIRSEQQRGLGANLSADELWLEATDFLSRQTNQADFAEICKIGQAKLQAGKYRTAEAILRRGWMLAARMRGEADPETLILRHEHAMALGHSGRYREASEHLVALLPIQEQVIGAEDRETLKTRSNIAFWTYKTGDIGGARDEFVALLPIQERVLGPKDRQTIKTRSYLASYRGRAGDAAGARDEFEALLSILKGVFGAEDPDTLRTLGNLAIWIGEAGDAAGARDEFEALRPIQERVLGAEHPDTLAMRGNLAHWTGEAGDVAGARNKLDALLPIQERVLGAAHPDTLKIREDRAGWTAEAGDIASASDELVALLPIQERVLGADHPQTIETRQILAAVRPIQGHALSAEQRSR